MRKRIKTSISSALSALPGPVREHVHRDLMQRRLSGIPLLRDNGKAFVGTFHKSGTVLLLKIISSLCRRSNARFWQKSVRPDEPDRWDVCFDWDADFSNKEGLTSQQAPTVLVIRDPRDIIVSGSYYHVKSEEGWLQVADERFAGKTYQEAISALASAKDRFLFEMDHRGGETIERILARLKDPVLFQAKVVRYETLVSADRLQAFFDMFRFLGVDEAYLPTALEISIDNSLSQAKKQDASHVRSGAPRQWETEFDDETRQAFEKRFPDALSIMGYDEPL